MPPFDQYFFFERHAEKSKELKDLSREFPSRNVTILNEDANEALLGWCRALNSKKERAVVFLDPFGASVKWEAVAALGRTGAVDLWVLFPYSAINRMLVRNVSRQKPGPSALRRCLGLKIGRLNSTPRPRFDHFSIRPRRSSLSTSQRIIESSLISTSTGLSKSL